MNKTLKLLPLLVAAIISAAFNSCRVAPTDPDLDAQWQLMTVETAAETLVIDNPRIYYSFYRHTAMLTTTAGNNITANLSYNGKTLKLEFPGHTWNDLKRLHIEQSADNNQTESSKVSATDYPVVIFDVVKLNGKQLVLLIPDQAKTYTFRKY